MIEIHGLTKSVPTSEGVLTILNSVDLSIAEAETVAIVGASGSGKSTLLGLMAGLDAATSGDVLLGGHSLAAMDEEQRAVLRGQIVGFVFQSFQLLPSLTALENVMLPIELKGDAQARAKATALLERVGLAERITHYPNQLSGGEQQRVAIARAFATEAKNTLRRRAHRRSRHRHRCENRRAYFRSQQRVFDYACVGDTRRTPCAALRSHRALNCRRDRKRFGVAAGCREQ